MGLKKNIIKEVRDRLEKGNFEPFIRSIVFPKFKNIAPESTIEFTYPITAIVGGNGTNKTSILRALEGAPEGMSIGLKWFTTNVDLRLSSSFEDESNDPNRILPKRENLSEEERQCFFYRYRLPSGKLAEVLKARIKRYNDPDYWEPSRPVKKYGMEILNYNDIAPCDRGLISGKKNEVPTLKNIEDKTVRWAAVEKEVIFFSFKYTIPAFDLHYEFFNKELSAKEKKAWHRYRARWLSKIIENKLTTYKPGRKQRVVEPCIELSSEACYWVGQIIGRNYTSILLVKHCCFELEGYTVKLRSSGKDYSEAFAGSGEFSAVMLVNEILNASEKSLILLDEPETSLHPKAQRELMRFLTIQAKENGHQIVFATHSPECIRDLPPDAIKVLQISEDARKVQLLSQFSLPESAFSAIGSDISFRKIYVEDALAKVITESCLNKLGKGVSNIVAVPYGAESVMAGPLLATLARTQSHDYIILDGDQHPYVKAANMCNDKKCTINHSDYVTSDSFQKTCNDSAVLSCAQVYDYFDDSGTPMVDRIPLSNMDKALFYIGCRKTYFGLDGGNKPNDDQSIERSREILQWVAKHLRYLSTCRPETLLLQMCDSAPAGKIDSKQIWRDKAKEEITTRGEPTSEDILGLQKTRLKSVFNEPNVGSNVYVNSLINTLRDLLSL